MPRSDDDYHRRKRRKTSRASRGHERKLLRALKSQSTAKHPAPICRLLALPTELLYYVMDALESYPDACSCDPEDLELYDSEPVTLCGALLNLALTCKTLFHVTLPRLYQRVDTSPHFGFGDAAPCLLRTLCHRPDLAARVVELGVNCAPQFCVFRPPYSHHGVQRPGRDWIVTPGEAVLFNDEFRRHGIAGQQWTMPSYRAAGKKGAPPSYRIESVRAPRDPDFAVQWPNSASSALGALAIVKTPNIRRLVLMTDQGMRLPRCVVEPGRLERLTELHWQPSRNLGVHLGAMTLEDEFNWLTAAAPALRRVTIDLLEDVGRGVLPCPSVTELELRQASLSKTSMRRLGKVFPNLQHLNLEIEDSEDLLHGERVASLRSVLRQLARTYGGTLRTLGLDWDVNDYDDDGHRVGGLKSWPVQSLAYLRRMTALTDLDLTPELVYPPGSAHLQDHKVWRQILPPNLEVLTLDNLPMPWFALPLLAAMDDVCGKMQTIIVDDRNKPEDDAELQQMIKQGKLRYEFRNLDFELILDASDPLSAQHL